MSCNKTIKVGSRKSELALIQTRYVIQVLKNLYPENEYEIVTMSTLGDKILDVPLPKIGEKSLFTKELEAALINGNVDFVVHSLKDLPTSLPDGMAVGAVLKREDPSDALVVRQDLEATSLLSLPPGSVIGTSSLRRSAQLARNYPHLKVENIRGNLNTRMKKLDQLNHFSAIILAQAGLSRMGWQDRISCILSDNEMLYAVGQGALAVECREDDETILKMLQPLHDPETLLRVVAERSFLSTLGGGCSAPVAVCTHLRPIGNTEELSLKLIGSVWTLDGSSQVDNSKECTVSMKRLPNSYDKTNCMCDKTDVKKKPCDTCPHGTETKSVNHQSFINNSEKSVNKRCSFDIDGTTVKKGKFDIDSAGNGVPITNSDNVTVNEHIVRNLSTTNIENSAALCPVKDLPVGLDFMGKCPYLDGDSNLQPSVSGSIIENTGLNITQCPFLKKVQLDTIETQTVGEKDHKSKLYSGIVPSNKIPLWSLEQAMHLGKNVAELLAEQGACTIIKNAQNIIRAT